MIYPAVWPQQTWAEKWGCAPFSGDVGPPSNAMLPGSRPTCVPSGILIHPAIWSQQTWAKNCWGLCAFLSGEAVFAQVFSLLVNFGWQGVTGRHYFRDEHRNWQRDSELLQKQLYRDRSRAFGIELTQCGLGQGLPPYQLAS